MIDWNKSAELNESTVDQLKSRFERFPASGKMIVSVCNGCGKIRTCRFVDYCDLCSICNGIKLGTGNAGENNPMYGRSGVDSPRYGIEHTANTKLKMSESAIGKHTGENNGSKRDDVREKISASKIEFWKIPGIRDTMSETIKNSEAAKAARKNNADSKRGVPLSPEHKAAVSRGLEESGANDKMRGGHDIVWHHIIYDHDDLSKNTIGMTRSDHQKLHQLLRKLGYIIPHINVKGVSS